MNGWEDGMLPNLLTRFHASIFNSQPAYVMSLVNDSIPLFFHFPYSF